MHQWSSVAYYPYICQIQWRALDEINAGACDGMTYEEIKKNMPEEYGYVIDLFIDLQTQFLTLSSTHCSISKLNMTDKSVMRLGLVGLVDCSSKFMKQYDVPISDLARKTSLDIDILVENLIQMLFKGQ